MSERIYTIEDIRRIVSPIARRYGISKLWLFGSYAKGLATPNSDVDILIENGRLRTMWELGGLYEDLREGLDKELDLITTGNSDRQFLQRIQPEQVMLYANT